MKLDDNISFRYKGNRFVKGKVTFVDGNAIGLILETDYNGKNVFWEKGEFKTFNIKEMKKITIEKH
jgi:hypothetical protein